jgi:hypothetical protein
VNLQCHSGSFYAIPLVYTPEFLRQCRDSLDKAAAAARGNNTFAARVEMASEGLKNAEQYMAIHEAMNEGDFQRAKRVYDQLLQRSQRHQETRLGNHYTVGYLKRFVGKLVEAGAAATATPNRVVCVLPDRWRLAYDAQGQGVAEGFHKADLDDANWKDVSTYSSPLDAQGVLDRQTIMWYRTRFELPKGSADQRLLLFFTEVDGDATVYVNGRETGASESKRRPFTVDITDHVTDGRNAVAVRVDHSKITELFLGGIIRPVLLVAAAGE